MKTLEFVNASGPEPWKNKDAKKFVRSHAMKDFRRKQREGTGGGKRCKVTQPGEGTRIVASKRALRLKPRSKQAASISTVTPFKQQSEPPLAGLRFEFGRPLDRLISTPLAGSNAHETTALDRNMSSLPSPTSSASSRSSFSASSSSSSSSPTSPSFSSPANFALAAGECVDASIRSDFNMSISIAVYSVLDAVQAQFDRMTRIYFNSTHTWLTMIRKQRFMKRVAASRIKANAEFATLLLTVRLMAEPFEHHQAGGNPSHDRVYRTAKNLHRIVHASKGPSLELIQAGLLITLYEHNNAISQAYNTLINCSTMSTHLGLDTMQQEANSENLLCSAMDEENLRTYWSVVIVDRVIALQDDKLERPLIMPEPLPGHYLPSVRDDDWENSDSGLPELRWVYTVCSTLPKNSDSFCRQVQASRLMGLVQHLIRTPFEANLAVMRTQILEVDEWLQEALAKLLSDCDGGVTQHCGPISLCIAGCFLLHGYQLRATLTSSDSDDMEAAARSKLVIERMISIIADILRSFPIQHLPELSPAALFCPYAAAMHALHLQRINGLRSQPTLDGNDIDLFVNVLKNFSSMWNCTAEYVQNISRAQARALPLPQLIEHQATSDAP